MSSRFPSMTPGMERFSLNLPRDVKNTECTLKVAGGVCLDCECVGFVTAGSI